ncbi:MAG: hypothetical protein A2845_03325 [Candidatus Lloydbacteria bacterium RIFCSPHIGHO2_01_FULL_49_22]|uniref:Methyltransferase type 11 domain-containing protein n=1 Tax=Candidatus Lloydbacteria bacterium RIFCSPHIGHO2_01_FULL_49_22 TaxID=1798658 RepID=A0A1G2CWM4_9BACT|nr:MAG: hypothetical protein A2845_03325 [Candidatus Lloydbacteria bacterium RIFCSPHIGHO2_01_FULL_49_22]OGZ08962.1 MAG: hypothetical protein A3C14_03160 [Candidatus Lloydbacteria bacterium RIFCSPHIGHO2_02_FULL_50_18]
MNDKKAQILSLETQHSYDQMAKEFSDSRAHFWNELAFLSEHIERDDHVLDIGCGNGRFVPLVSARHAHYDGVDYSSGLIEEAKRKFPQQCFTVGDATALPFPDDSFDIAFSFAVIHHIPGKEGRNEFAREAFRVLHPGGKLIITSWDLWSRKYVGRLLRSAISSMLQINSLDVRDVMLTFGKKKQPRYVHAFTAPELRELFKENGFTILGIDTVPRDSVERNIVLIAQKPT